jgi:predicted AlkP superfamily pyrophosphatase or phosphodiesterase
MKKFLFAVYLLTAFYAQAQEKPYVILISFDGFRHDYVERFNPPNFNAFIEKGSKAKALIPSFPSKTFPNHYSIVTGLNPGNHGLVDNSFYDRARNETYGMSDKLHVPNPYYYGGVPLWELAKRNGVKSASFFWVGSELSDAARRPDYYFPFNDSIPPATRIEQTLKWLTLPIHERPHLITLYFSFPDHEGHTYGPESEQTRLAVLRADSLLGKLMTGIDSIKLPVNVILVSDHGMRALPVKKETFIFLDEIIDRKNPAVKVVNNGAHAHVYLLDLTKRDSVYTRLTSGDTYRVLKKEDFPKRWHYNNARTGDLLIVAKPDHYIRSGTQERFLKSAKLGSTVGEHGYDPHEVEDMQGIFYAQGPNIKSGITINPFQNIHIYPLIAKILSLPLPEIEGNEKVLIGLYKK